MRMFYGVHVMKGILHSLPQIYSATFLPDIIKICQHLTLWKPKGWTFC